MPHRSTSALITDNGQRVLLRIHVQFYNLDQQELRGLLGLPPGAPGLGISVDGDTLQFEFASDQQTIEMSSSRLKRLLAKQATAAR